MNATMKLKNGLYVDIQNCEIQSTVQLILENVFSAPLLARVAETRPERMSVRGLRVNY